MECDLTDFVSEVLQEIEYKNLEEEEEEKKDPIKTFNAVMTIDSEWGKDGKFLTLQLLVQIQGFDELLFVYYNSDHRELFERNQLIYLATYQKRMKELIQEEQKQPPNPIFVPWEYNPTEGKIIFEDVLIKICETLNFHSENLQDIQLNFFSSVVDLYHLFSIFRNYFFGKKFIFFYRIFVKRFYKYLARFFLERFWSHH